MKRVLLSLALLAGVSAFAKPLNRVYPGDRGVTKMTNAQFQALPPALKRTLGSVDVPFEMGDGYYDLVSERWYRIRSTVDGRVLGYLNEVRLSYTEDAEYVDVLVRFAADGRRIGKIEELGRESRE